jgi:hypothetical protein
MSYDPCSSWCSWSVFNVVSHYDPISNFNREDLCTDLLSRYVSAFYTIKFIGLALSSFVTNERAVADFDLENVSLAGERIGLQARPLSVDRDLKDFTFFIFLETLWYLGRRSKSRGRISWLYMFVPA